MLPGYSYGTPTVQPPPGLILGDEWWQQLASYGLGRVIDAETLKPYQTQDVARQLGLTESGSAYMRGQPAGLGAALSSPLVIALGVAAVGLVAYAALK